MYLSTVQCYYLNKSNFILKLLLSKLPQTITHPSTNQALYNIISNYSIQRDKNDDSQNLQSNKTADSYFTLTTRLTHP